MPQEHKPRRGTPEYERILEEERLILAATELVCGLMKKQNVSRADLARTIGRTRGHVTQVLDGSRNMTLRTLADIAFALGHRAEVAARPRTA
ncbi:MAG: helix-turn-helix transcriptional regulator [Actinomycetota bacterium]